MSVDFHNYIFNDERKASQMMWGTKKKKGKKQTKKQTQTCSHEWWVTNCL